MLTLLFSIDIRRLVCLREVKGPGGNIAPHRVSEMALLSSILSKSQIKILSDE